MPLTIATRFNHFARPTQIIRKITYSLMLTALATLSGCGESSKSTGLLGEPVDRVRVQDLQWEPYSFKSSDEFANLCATPRRGTDPATGKSYPDRAGSDLYEKFWLRSISQETYLWPDEIIDQDPHNYSVLGYFEQLKSNELADNGQPKDRFHFYEKSSDQYQNFVLGEDIGYGIEWRLINNKATVIYVQPSSPAEVAGVRRGMQVVKIDGKIPTDAPADANAALFPSETGRSHTFEFTTASGGSATFNLQSDNIQNQSVFPLQTLTGLSGEKIGYMGFHSFNGPSEKALIDAVNTLNNNQVSELIIDLRYNGGGYIGVASELAYMIAGSQKTAGKVFSRTRYNAALEAELAQYPDELNEPFATTTYGFSQNVSKNQPLPQLNLTRLYVLTSEGTCSASELLINSLRGIDFPVIQIGTTSCGKPYGFFNLANCGYQYYTINLQTQNAKGFGDYAYGMSPLDSKVNQGSPAGCVVADDINHELGSADEHRVAAALQHIATGKCTSTASLRGLLPIGNVQTVTRLPFAPTSFLHDNMVKVPNQ